jgi:hypothetical protein
MEAAQVPLAMSLLPGQVPNKLIERVEDVMNATIREAVFVTEHLDSGEIEDAMVALLQLKLNAELASKLIHDALGTLQKRRAQ